MTNGQEIILVVLESFPIGFLFVNLIQPAFLGIDYLIFIDHYDFFLSNLILGSLIWIGLRMSDQGWGLDNLWRAIAGVD